MFSRFLVLKIRHQTYNMNVPKSGGEKRS